MKLKKLPQFKERNHLALHPLLHKGGVHHSQKVDVARKRKRREVKNTLRKLELGIDADYNADVLLSDG